MDVQGWIRKVSQKRLGGTRDPLLSPTAVPILAAIGKFRMSPDCSISFEG